MSLAILFSLLFLGSADLSREKLPRRYGKRHLSHAASSGVPLVSSDIGEDEDGTTIERMKALEEMYGNYSSIPGFQRNYLIQAAIHSAAETVGQSSWRSIGPGYNVGDQSGRIR